MISSWADLFTHNKTHESTSCTWAICTLLIFCLSPEPWNHRVTICGSWRFELLTLLYIFSHFPKKDERTKITVPSSDLTAISLNKEHECSQRPTVSDELYLWLIVTIPHQHCMCHTETCDVWLRNTFLAVKPPKHKILTKNHDSYGTFSSFVILYL